MILVLKRDKEHRGAAYKYLADEVFVKGVKVRALTTEATLKVKNLNEIVMVLRQQCDVQVTTAAVRLRKGPARTQVALIQLPVTNVNKSVKEGKLKVGWSVCELTFHEPP